MYDRAVESDIAVYLAKQACAEVVYRLARGLDRCDAELVRSTFHDDATDDHGIFRGTADEFVAWVVPQLLTMERTQHLIGNVLIEVDGDRAWGESYYVANHDLKGASGEELRYTAAGRYIDRFERRDGTWRIAHRLCVSDWCATSPRSDNWDRTSGPRQYGLRGKGDPVYLEPTAATKGIA
jgi:hypothetical protein